ncbi:MAG: alpha/beta fold hydrolase [Saprospiraceae bacterium]|jgi:non-heme chloroperoxidase
MDISNTYSTPLTGEETFITTADGTRIRAVVRGEGTPVVLAHGYAVDRHEWNIVAEELAKRNFKVIAFDQRGHGESSIGRDGVGSRQMSEDYLAVLRAFDVNEGILVGHSMGGFLAIRTLISAPDVVSRHLRACVLLATFAGDVNRDNPQNRMQIPMIRMGLMGLLIRNRAIARGFAKTLLGEDKDPRMLEAFVDGFGKTSLKQLLPILNAMVAENYYDRLGQIALPCTIIVGTHDKTTPPFHTDQLHAGIKGSRLVKLPGKGHILNWEAPAVLVEEIVRLAAQ